VPGEDAMAYGMHETAVVELPRPNTRIVVAARVAHGLISLVFLCCIALLYVDAWRGSMNAVTLAALVALWVEGVLVLLSGGNCPLEPLFRKLGDDTPLFELLLPPSGERARGCAPGGTHAVARMRGGASAPRSG
jgi:hypothetical protein